MDKDYLNKLFINEVKGSLNSGGGASDIKKLAENRQIGSVETTSILLNSDNRKVTRTRDLVGATVTNHVTGRRKLVVPAERPVLAGPLYGGVYRDDNNIKMEMEYGTCNGMLSKPCFLLTGKLLSGSCVLFMPINSPYDSLLYAYEDTTDNLGVGITFKPGWYALNSTTFAHEPIDIEKYPVYFSNECCYIVSPTDEVKAFFESIFPLAETVTFTVTEQHFVDMGDNDRMVLNTQVPYSYIEIIENLFWSGSDIKMFMTIHDYTSESGEFIEVDENYGGLEGTTITWEDAIPIDPKFLPEGVKEALDNNIGRIDKTFTEIFPKTTVAFISEGETMHLTSEIVPSEALVKDTLYRVIWDGVTYDVACIEVNMDGMSLHYIGNGGFGGMLDTGEPFLIACQDDMWQSITTSAGNHTVSITKVTEVATISPAAVSAIRYPFIDLTDYQIAIDSPIVTIADSSVTTALKSYLGSGMPAVLVRYKYRSDAGSNNNIYTDILGYSEQYLNGVLDTYGYTNGRVTVTYSIQSNTWFIGWIGK